MSGLALPDGYVLHSATPQRHLLGCATMIPAEISVSGFEQAERSCRKCGAVCVTVLGPGFPWREWRCKPDGPQGVDAPPCPQLAEVAP